MLVSVSEVRQVAVTPAMPVVAGAVVLVHRDRWRTVAPRT